MNASILRAAEETPFLRGRRVRRYNPLAWIFGLMAITLAPGAIMLDPAWVAAGGAVLIAGVVLLLVHTSRAARKNNRAVARLMSGDDEGAAPAFVELATERRPRDVVVIALMNLGVIALRRCDFASAARLLAASVECAGGFRLAMVPDLMSGLARSHLALALAAVGDLDGAKREIRATHTQPTLAPAIAYAARARAYVSLREGQLAATLQTLDAERALLRNVLTGRESALAQAIEAVALGKMQELHAAAPRAPEPVLVDPDERAFVLAVLPEAQPWLVLER